MHWVLCAVAAATLMSTGAALAQKRDSMIQTIPAVRNIDPALVELGKKLFHDPRLSRSGFISCASCHNLSRGGSDNLKTSIGHNWSQGPINAPTVLNSSLNLAQFWDGRALTLKEQAGGPIANPGEMASTHEVAMDVLRSIPGYASEFRTVFRTDQMSIDQVTTALAAFQETLVTPNSRFDRWLDGEDNAITKDELAGYHLFRDSGCVACHNGPNAGGTSFQRLGVVQAFQSVNPQPIGRAGVTGRDADRFKHKVPTMRNVELTYPYFFDGSARTLTEAVDVMGRLQLGRVYTAQENAQIVAFLKTLTGQQPRLMLPILPPSSDKTPPPRPFN
ncbi:MAG: cytochrome-c peroxidase [Hydrogenophaga sp.]|nr:cytochrome-c peroxidase [Hydrogenophaga sp.]